jgi:hypothetical protein
LFFTPEMRAWLGGYRPRIAAELCAPAAGKPRDAEAAERLRDARERGSDAWRVKEGKR